MDTALEVPLEGSTEMRGASLAFWNASALSAQDGHDKAIKLSLQRAEKIGDELERTKW